MKFLDARSPLTNLPMSMGRAAILLGSVCALHIVAMLMLLEGDWIWIAGGAAAAIVAVLLLLRPASSLMVGFAFLPIQPLINDVFAKVSPLVAAGKDVLMAVIVASLLFNYLIRRRPMFINTPMYWLIIFALVGAVMAGTAPDPIRGFLALRFIALYPAIIVLAANSIETEADLNRILKMIVIVGLVTVAYGILQYLTQFDVPYRTSGGDVRLRMGRFDEMAMVSTFASRPMFGGWLVPLYLLFLLVKRQGWGRAWGTLRLIGGGAVLGCALLTYSRSIWIAFVVATLVAIWLQNRMKAMLAASAFALGLVVFYASLTLLAPASIKEAATSGASFQERLSYWPMVFRHVAAHPFGMGLGTVGGPHLFEEGAQADAYGNLQYDPFELFDSQAGLGPGGKLMVTDNTFLKLLVQGGAPLLIPFLGMILGMFRLISSLLAELRGPRDLKLRELVIWAAGCLAALLVIFMFVDFLESGPAIALYWLVLGILCCIRKFTNETRGESVELTPSESGAQRLLLRATN
jgi:hypothetical protein